MLIINLLETRSLKKTIPVTDEKIIVPPVINGYKTVAGKFFAPFNCKNICQSVKKCREYNQKSSPHKPAIISLVCFYFFGTILQTYMPLLI